MNKRVGILKCAAYDSPVLYRALCEAVEAAEVFDVRDKRVLLKPNIVFDSLPEKAITTHPAFLEAVIRLVRERGASRILVGDSPGLQGPNFSARLSGLGELTRRMGAEWRDFTREKMEIPCPKGRVSDRFTVTGVVGEADCVISLPKLKTHQLMFFTGAMKNLFGLVPSLLKSPCHVKFPRREDFAAMIVDLNIALRTALTADYAFMDAVVGMEGPGPGSSGYPRKIGLVLASSNLLAIDAAACAVIGYQPGDIPICRDALERGLWLNDFAEIEYPLKKPEEVEIRDFKKIPLRRTGNQLLEFVIPGYQKLRQALTPRPEIQNGICLRCGDCARICGSQAITLRQTGEDRRMVIDYRSCIRCYCCHEICPVKAIEIRRPRPGLGTICNSPPR
jgi:uncharacterized protein (DUF362 family)/Pyruvate/2-oxoacid:ferredoxin oxidoreductase delta subunit